MIYDWLSFVEFWHWFSFLYFLSVVFLFVHEFCTDMPCLNEKNFAFPMNHDNFSFVPSPVPLLHTMYWLHNHRNITNAFQLSFPMIIIIYYSVCAHKINIIVANGKYVCMSICLLQKNRASSHSLPYNYNNKIKFEKNNAYIHISTHIYLFIKWHMQSNEL